MSWHTRYEVALVRSAHDDRLHEVRTSCLFQASDLEAWESSAAALRSQVLDKEARQRLLDTCVPVGALVRELQREVGRRRTVEAVLAAARRLERSHEPRAGGRDG